MIPKSEVVESMVRIAITDDHPIVRKGMADLISRNVAYSTIDEASTGGELIEMVKHNLYDLILLDISLPDMDGWEVLKELRKQKQKLPVLMVSMYPEEEYAVRALRAGASGYFSKRGSVPELLEAVHKILSGKRYASLALAEKMLLDFETNVEKAPHERLSNREFQVMCMLGEGKTVREISQAIHLSANTVRTYRLRILDKFGAKGTNQLIHYAVTHRLGD